MATSSQTVTGQPLPRADRNQARRRERLFFGGMVIALMVAVFAGFARSYYLQGYFGAPELTALMHWHGAVFTAWMLLLLTQASLVSAHRVDLHRRLGLVGVPLAVLMIVVGSAIAIVRAQQGLLGVNDGVSPNTFLAIPLLGMVVFAALFGAAIHYRRRSDFHKRLVLLATVEIATAGVARIPGIAGNGPLAFFGATDLFVVGLVLYDLVTLKRVHPATLWGGLLLVVSQPLRLVVSETAAWQAIAAWLTG